jgi:hypothetical protein
LPSDGLVNVAVEVCFGCHGKVFTSRCLAMDDYSEPAIPAFNHHVMIRYLSLRSGAAISSTAAPPGELHDIPTVAHSDSMWF